MEACLPFHEWELSWTELAIYIRHEITRTWILTIRISFRNMNCLLVVLVQTVTTVVFVSNWKLYLSQIAKCICLCRNMNCLLVVLVQTVHWTVNVWQSHAIGERKPIRIIVQYQNFANFHQYILICIFLIISRISFLLNQELTF